MQFTVSPGMQDFEGGIRSRDRQHGDPFPLPYKHRNLMKASVMDADSHLHTQLMNEAVKSVNGLASATLNSRRALRHDRSPCPSLRPTKVQEAMLQDMSNRLDFFVENHHTMSEETAL